MSEITMCTQNDCGKKDICYRFQKKPNEYKQSYISYPTKDCVNKDYALFWEILGKQEIKES